MTAPMLADYFAARKVMPPFASDDTSLLLDVDFRDGEAAVEAYLVSKGMTGEGGTNTSTWDATLGWKPNGKVYYTNSGWTPTGHASLAAAFASQQFTVFVEIQRSAIASCWMDDSSNFIDENEGPSAACWNGTACVPSSHPYGDYTSAKFGYVFTANPGSGSNNISAYYQVTNNATFTSPVGRFVVSHHDGSATNATVRARAGVPSVDGINADFAQLVITCNGREMRWYLDGHCINRETRAADFWNEVTNGLFNRIYFGSNTTGAASPFKGYIRRFQLANKFSYNDVREGPRIAFLGDSFTQRGAGHATPGASTVAAVDAVQNGLTNASLVETLATVTSNTIVGGHWRPWIHEIVRVAANQGLPFSFYCAGAAGRGWALTGSSTALPQFQSHWIDAVIGYDAEIVVGSGSVNDVNGSNTATNYLAEVQAVITSIIQGSYNIRRFLFVETFPAFNGYSTWTATYTAEYHRQRALQAQLDGFTVTNAAGIDVSVEFIPVYDAIGGENYPAAYNEGGSDYALLWDTFFVKTGGSAKYLADLHPGQQGMDMMVDIMWPHIKRAILGLPRD